MHRSICGYVLTVCWLLPLAVGCNGSHSSSTIKIGVLAPHNTQPGEGIRNAAKMAVEEINAAGGIDGRLLEIVEENTEYSSEKCVRGYQRLAGRNGAVAVIGVAGDGIFPIMKQLKKYRVPMVTTGTGSDRLTEMVAEDPASYKWFFRVMHKSSELGQVTSDFAINCLSRKHDVKKFAIMVEDDIWTKYIRDIWVDELGKNPDTEVVFEDTFSSQTKDFSLMFQQIADSQAGYILDACSRVDASSYLKRWAAMHGPPIGAVQTGSGTERYYNLIGDDGLHVCSVATVPSNENSLTSQSGAWWDRYHAKHGDPAYTSAYTYDAVHLLANAIRRAGSTDAEKLVAALEETDYEGAAARWEFDSSHHSKYGAGYRQIPIMQYQEPGPRGFKVIWPEDRATASFVKIQR